MQSAAGVMWSCRLNDDVETSESFHHRCSPAHIGLRIHSQLWGMEPPPTTAFRMDKKVVP